MTDSGRTIADGTVATEEPTGQTRERALLVVYEGTGPDAHTRLLDLPDGAQVTFGRSRRCTVRIDSERVSRVHARIARRGREIRVEDLDSRNGTRVNGAKIDALAKVASGDEIGVGPATAVVTITTRVARTAPIGSVSYLQERLAAEVDRGQRYRRGFALVMLRIDADAALSDEALDAVSARLRPMDVLAEYGPDEYAIVLPEAGREAALEILGRIVQDLRGQGTEERAVQSRAGLALFPEHGTDAEVLVSRARAALRRARTEGYGEVAAPPEEPSVTGDDLVVGDPQMERVYTLVHKVASHPITVLIAGETGVGKEVVAQELHRTSERKSAAFVCLNCASLPETLLESELFGHERGSFTGASRRRIGYFEAASHGTIFLDEIGEMSPRLQAKLLRVLEDGKLTRVGGVKEIDVDVRVVCATNRDLDEEVARGEFREDLFFRISAFTIVVPPLRDRPAEIPLLARHFVSQAARDLTVGSPTLTADALQALGRYAWPGNVRELRNAMERAVVLQAAGVIDLEHLPDRVREAELRHVGRAGPAAIGNGVDMRDHIAEVERIAIVAALQEFDGNQTRAAQKLGISRRALIYKLEKHGLKKPPKHRGN